MLEDRALLAYSPSVPGFIYGFNGWIVLTVPPGFSSALSGAPTVGGSSFSSSGSGGGNIGTSFSINGFGTSSIQVGNNTGYSALAAQQSRSTTTGGGSAGPGGIAGSTTGASGTTAIAPGYGASVSSGGNTALNSSNNYGMTTAIVGSTAAGSAPVQTYADANASASVLQANTGNANANDVASPTPMPGTNPSGGPNLFDNLLGKKSRMGALPISPSINPP